MPDKPGLEILIRKTEKGKDGADISSFELKLLDSSQVFLRMCPERVEGVEVEENAVDESTAGRLHVLRNVRTDRYLRVNKREYFLWQRMDGSHTIQDLASAYFFEFGSFEFETLGLFLNKARRLGLIRVSPTGLLRSRSAGAGTWFGRLLKRLDRFDRRIEGVDGLFKGLHAVLRPIYSLWALPFLAALVAVGGTLYVQHRAVDRFGAATYPGYVSFPVFLLIGLAGLTLHELSHGVACRAFGRRVKGIGITLLDRILPVVYVDVTDTWMSTWTARLVVSLAGPAASLVLAAIASILAYVVDSPAASWWLMTAADANLLATAYTLWPFLGVREDGYHALGDAFRISALRARAWQMFRAMLSRGDPADRWPKGAWVLLGYLILTWLTWLGLAVLLVWVLL